MNLAVATGSIISKLSQMKNKLSIVLVGFLLWVVALATIAWLWNHWMLNGPYGPYRWVGMDFAPFWVGVREMLHGADPYSQDTLLKIQRVVYGGPALGNDPMMFVYPAWMFIVIAPFSLMPFQYAVILFSGTLLWGMLGVLYLISSNLSGRRFFQHTFWMVWLTLGSLPFLIISITKGQLGYLSLIALFVSRRAWARRPYIAGIVLGLALIKPTVTVIPVAGYLLWALLEKDWKFLAGFSGCVLVLLVTSLFASGNWIPGYLSMLTSKGGMPVIWSVDILPNPWKLLYITFYITLGVYTLFVSKRKNQRDLWLPITFLIGIALFPMRWIYDLYLGILIPSEESNLTKIQSVVVAVAAISPWVLVFVTESARWNVAVIGLPVIWTVCALFLFLPRFILLHWQNDG